MLASHSDLRYHRLFRYYFGAVVVLLTVCVTSVWLFSEKELSTTFASPESYSPLAPSVPSQLNSGATTFVTDKERNDIATISSTTTTVMQAGSFTSALESEDYVTAITEYEHLYASRGIDESDVYRQMIINHASAHIQNRETQKAIDLLRAYLAVFYSDVDALFTVGRAYRNDARWFEAIQAFQDAERYAYQATNIRVIRGQVNYAIGFYMQELKQQQKSDEVIELFQYLTASQPETPRYFIGLANAYSAQRRYGEAIDSLRYIQNDYEEGAEARSMIQKLTQLRTSWLNVDKP